MKIKREKIAFEKGYRVKDGVVTSSKNNIRKLQLQKKPRASLYPTFSISITHENKKFSANVYVHRLVAYQKIWRFNI